MVDFSEKQDCLMYAEAEVLGEGDEASDEKARTQGIFQQLLPMPSEGPAGADAGEMHHHSTRRRAKHAGPTCCPTQGELPKTV